MASNNKILLNQKIENELINNLYNCSICFCNISKKAKTWDCKNCFTIFHLSCTRRWICESSKFKNMWKCPACNFANDFFDIQYYCFCQKFLSPDFNPFVTPHSCGDLFIN